jgi:hypothetical protein
MKKSLRFVDYRLLFTDGQTMHYDFTDTKNLAELAVVSLPRGTYFLKVVRPDITLDLQIILN